MTRTLAVSLIAAAVMLGACSTTRIAGIKPVDTITQAGAASGYEQGKAQLKAGNSALAIAAFRQDLSRQGASARSYNGLALAYQALGRADVAESYLHRALAIDPNSAETVYNLSLVKFHAGSFAEAARFAALARDLVERADVCGDDMRASVTANAARLATFAAWERGRLEASLAQRAPLERAGARLWTLDLAETSVRPAAEPKKAVAPAKRAERAEAPSVLEKPGLRIVNALGRDHMASRMASYLKAEGVSVNALANAKRYRWVKTEIRYKAGHREAAAKLAKLLPVPVKLVETDGTRNEMELHLGGDLLSFDRSLHTA